MAASNDFGRWGEDVAAAWLLEHGFDILARNWRHGRKEIDIVAASDGSLYFVEVKTRHGETWNAEEAVNDKKRALMWRAMMAWKTQHPSLMPVRYAALAVVAGEAGAPPVVRWHDDVWNMM